MFSVAISITEEVPFFMNVYWEILLCNHRQNLFYLSFRLMKIKFTKSLNLSTKKPQNLSTHQKNWCMLSQLRIYPFLPQKYSLKGHWVDQISVLLIISQKEECERQKLILMQGGNQHKQAKIIYLKIPSPWTHKLCSSRNCWAFSRYLRLGPGSVYLMLELYTFDLIAIKQAEPFPVVLSQCITVARYNRKEVQEKGKRKG